MKRFEHFIITRFNVRVDYSKTRVGVDLDWLCHRFQLFEQFCYPSVRNQSNQNFKWLVYFDSETPEVFKNKINAYAEWQNFIPIYVDREFTRQLNRSSVLNHLTDDSKYLITTRLDNDDAVSRDFVQIIQDKFCEQILEFINFTYGYVWSEGKIYLHKYLNNPFLSLIERVNDFTDDGFKTVLCGEHTQLSSVGMIRQVKTKPTWMQVIHSRNVSNRIRGIRQPIKRLGDDFAISPECVPNEEQLLPYLLDKGFSLLKAPLDSLVIALPKDTRASLKKIWTMLQPKFSS